MTTLRDDVDAVREAFPDWSLFVSDEGIYYATRRGVRLTDDDIHRGLHQTVSAGDLATVVALLEDQERLAPVV